MIAAKRASRSKCNRNSSMVVVVAAGVEAVVVAAYASRHRLPSFGQEEQ